MEDVLFPISEARKIVKGFLACTLTSDEWTHEAHLMVALWMLAEYGTEAFEEMKNGLQRFNPTVNRSGTFHATLTWFWLKIVQKHLQNEERVVQFNQETIDDLLFDEALVDRNLWTQHYTKEEIFSEKARMRIIEKPI